jgi:LysM repeat protein
VLFARNTQSTVAKGETIIKIAQQYHKTSAIYELNPEARKGIKFKSTLLIPSSAKEIVKLQITLLQNTLKNTCSSA